MADWRADLVQRSFAAFGELDLDSVRLLYQPDCEWEMGPAAAALRSTYRGHEGLAELIADLDSVFPDWKPRIDELRARHDGAALTRWSARGTARITGMELDYSGGQVIEFRDRRIAGVTETGFPPPGWDRATLIA